jgi:hypothetical protein
MDEWLALRKASTWIQDNTNIEKRLRTPNIHALSGIWNHDSGSEQAKAVHALDRSATVTG